MSQGAYILPTLALKRGLSYSNREGILRFSAFRKTRMRSCCSRGNSTSCEMISQCQRRIRKLRSAISPVLIIIPLLLLSELVQGGAAGYTVDAAHRCSARGEQLSAEERRRWRMRSPSLTASTATSVSTVESSNDIVPTLDFWGSMTCGAISRSVAKFLLHPANTAKTIAQTKRRESAGNMKRVAEAALEGTYAGVVARRTTSTLVSSLPRPPNPSDIAPNTNNIRILFRGAGAQLFLSSFLGAANFAILEETRKLLDSDLVQSHLLPKRLRSGRGGIVGDTGKDFVASCVSTTACSILSIPHMVIMDNIMAGTAGYSNLPQAIRTLSKGGIRSYYRGGWAHIFGKVPAYAISWSCFQRLKRMHRNVVHRDANNRENMLMGSIASGVSVCVMIPYETVKTRLVTQQVSQHAGMRMMPYRGIFDGFSKIVREEGPVALFSGLRPRLISVVPMLAIQMAMYEACKREYLQVRGGNSLEPNDERG